MKKILSVAAVAAIVTSAFAFANTNKAQTFCIKQGNACAIIHDKVEDPAGAPFTHFPLGPGRWNGTQAGCVNANPNTDCIVNVLLRDN